MKQILATATECSNFILWLMTLEEEVQKAAAAFQ